MTSRFLAVQCMPRDEVSDSESRSKKKATTRMVHPAVTLPLGVPRTGVCSEQAARWSDASASLDPAHRPYNPYHDLYYEPSNNPKDFAPLKMHKMDPQSEKDPFYNALDMRGKWSLIGEAVQNTDY